VVVQNLSAHVLFNLLHTTRLVCKFILFAHFIKKGKRPQNVKSLRVNKIWEKNRVPAFHQKRKSFQLPYRNKDPFTRKVEKKWWGKTWLAIFWHFQYTIKSVVFHITAQGNRSKTNLHRMGIVTPRRFTDTYSFAKGGWTATFHHLALFFDSLIFIQFFEKNCYLLIFIGLVFTYVIDRF